MGKFEDLKSKFVKARKKYRKNNLETLVKVSNIWED